MPNSFANPSVASFVDGIEAAPAQPAPSRGSPHVAIVAGEPSGDLLGAGLMVSLRRRLPQATFEGIGGPAMGGAGLHALFAMEHIQLMGFEGLIGKLGGILRVRRSLQERFTDTRPDVFVGVDVPDFNISLEKRLRGHGIPTVHYVSPTVWAWRRYRLRKIRGAVDRMLTLFPFEADFYREKGVPVQFVGHPMADEIEENVDSVSYRQALGLPPDARIVALLPGSRASELARHVDLFLATAAWLHRREPSLIFAAPLVDEQNAEVFRAAQARLGASVPPVHVYAGSARAVMAAADVVLLASGTAALEAALLGRPMVVTYRVTSLSYMLIRFLAHTDVYSMPNHLAGRELVPELIQSRATADNLGEAVLDLLRDPARVADMQAAFRDMYRTLRCNASERAAEAVLDVLEERGWRRRPASA